MAKRSTKVKKPTEEFPPLRGVIEKGAIRPAFAYDAERLDSFRSNANVLVWISYDGDRPLIRKWWAIIGWYLKNTTLPWGDKETASAAIKLALTMIEPFQLPSGQWAQYPQTLTKFDDAELEIKIREMQQLLYEITGVDQETMRQNGGSLGDEPFETTQPANDAGDETLADGAVPPPASEEGAGAGQTQSPVLPDGTGATDLPETATERLDDLGSVQDGLKMSTDGQPSPGDESGPAPDDGGGADSPTAPPPTELSPEDRVWLKQGVRMMLACQLAHDQESLRVLVIQLRAIREIIPNGVSDAALKRMEAARLHAMAVCKGQAELDKTFMATTALARLDEVEPEPVKVRSE
jgi:hypothetical protein